MKNEFTPYDIALALKELGFNEECLGWFRDKVILYGEKDGYDEVYGLKAPTYSQAFRWFEENYDDAITVRTYKMSNGVRWYDYSVNEFGGRCKDREEAELACLRKLIEIVKNERD